MRRGDIDTSINFIAEYSIVLEYIRAFCQAKEVDWPLKRTSKFPIRTKRKKKLGEGSTILKDECMRLQQYNRLSKWIP